MSWDPAALTITGLIATILSLIFAVAAHSSSKKRTKERISLRRLLETRQQASEAAFNPSSEAGNDSVVTTSPPAQSPVKPRSHISAETFGFASHIPPAVGDAPPRSPNTPITMFKRYVQTQPESAQPPAPGETTPKPDDDVRWD